MQICVTIDHSLARNVVVRANTESRAGASNQATGLINKTKYVIPVSTSTAEYGLVLWLLHNDLLVTPSKVPCVHVTLFWNGYNLTNFSYMKQETQYICSLPLMRILLQV